MKVIGIDPGTTTVGYAIVEQIGNQKTLHDYGVIHTTPKAPLSEKIVEIGHDIDELITLHQPGRVVIEKLFFTTNLKTGIDVAQVRGVLVYKFANLGIEVLEYTPLELKSAICGNGKANKLQLQNAIKIFFGLSEIPKPDDAADAIGLAYMGILKKF